MYKKKNHFFFLNEKVLKIDIKKIVKINEKKIFIFVSVGHLEPM